MSEPLTTSEPERLTIEPGIPMRATRPSRGRARLLAFVRAHPWAMAPDAFETMLAVLGGDSLIGPDTLRAAFNDDDDALEADGDGFARVGRVAVVPIFGVIAHRVNLVSRMSGGTSTEGIASAVTRAAADPEIAAIVLDINSPGGGVYGVHEAHAAITRARSLKPVVAAIDGLGASAAYWLASAAGEITITTSSEVGSIGVFGVHEDWSKRFAAEGITPTIFRAGPHKNDDSRYEPLSDDARAALQSRVDAYYRLFLADVAAGRGAAAEVVGARYGQGRVMGAPDALAAGMVDRLADREAVVSTLNASSSAAPMARVADVSRRAALAQAAHALAAFDLRQ